MSKRIKLVFFIGLILVLLFGAVAVTGLWPSDQTKVERMLKRSELLPLPLSARNVLYYRWSGFFTGETLAKFELSASDLQAFITNSPALQFIQPKEIYDINHPHMPYPESTNEIVSGPYYFQMHSKFPSWYDLTIKGNGRMYFLWADKWVYIDEDRNIVWLRFVKG